MLVRSTNIYFLPTTHNANNARSIVYVTWGIFTILQGGLLDFAMYKESHLYRRIALISEI